MNTTLLFIISLCFICYILYLLFIKQRNLDITTYYCFDKHMNQSNNTKVIPKAFKKSGLTPVKHYSQADIIFTYNHDQFHLLSSLKKSKAKYIYGLRCVNLFASKSTLAMIVDKDIIPKTWILTVDKDVEDLRKQFVKSVPKIHLILKNNLQRQSGLKLVKNIDDLTKEYLICQEIIQNPLIIANRRIVLRVYMLLVCNESTSRCYIYNDGFIYYTKEEYSFENVTYDNTITSGYIDRKIYDENALTIKDLYHHLPADKSNKLQDNITKSFSGLYRSYKSHLKKNDTNDGTNRFIILGADVLPTNDYNVKLLEINKGPDLGFKDTRDETLKTNLITDTLSLIQNNNTNNFIEIN